MTDYMVELIGLAHTLGASDDQTEAALEQVCIRTAGSRKAFEAALDDQRQVMSDMAAEMHRP